MPITAGSRELKNVPGATGRDAADVATASAYPVWLTVICTVICLRRSSGVGVYVVPVAPLIGAPSASHW